MRSVAFPVRVALATHEPAAILTQEEALTQVRSNLTVNIAVAGRAAFDVGTSQSYRLADAGVIPTIRLAGNRRVVVSAKLLEMLGDEAAA